MNYTITPIDNFTNAVNQLKSGDTLMVMPGDYSVPPNAARIQALHDVSIAGAGNPRIQITEHGDGIRLDDCLRFSIAGLTIRGQGYQTKPNDLYFALIHMEGRNDQLRIENCTLEDSGNHGIGALHANGPPETNNSVFRSNTIRRCGNLMSNSFKADGAGIAVGGSNNLYELNLLEDNLRGLEWENNYQGSFTCGNVARNNRILRSFWQALVAIPQHGVMNQFASNVIENNTIIGRGSLDPNALGWDGNQHMIELWGGTGWRITGNTLADSLGWCGVTLDPAKCSITDVEISGNTFLHLAGGGVWGQKNGSNTVNNVRLFGNTFGAMSAMPIKIEGDRITVSEDNRYGQLVGVDATGKSWKRVQCVGKDNHVPVDATL